MKKKEILKADKKLLITYMIVVLGVSSQFRGKLSNVRLNLKNLNLQAQITDRVESGVENLKKLIKTKTIEGGIKVEEVKGSVLVNRDGQEVSLDEDWDLKAIDILKTKSRSLVKISFGSRFQNRFTLGPNSTLRIESLFSKKKSSSTNSVLRLLRGNITSYLNDLESTEYEVKTKTTAFAVRGTIFFLQAKPGGKTILIVREGIVDIFNFVTIKKSQVEKGSTVLFLDDGMKIPITNPKRLKKIRNDFKKDPSALSTSSEEFFNSVFSRIDDVKINFKIKDKVVSIGSFIGDQIELKKGKLRAHPRNLKEKVSKYKVIEKNVIKDIVCLEGNGHCVLENDSELLKRGMVMTSGRRKLNIESISLLKKFITEKNNQIKVFKESKNELENSIKTLTKRRERIEKIKLVLYPEEEAIDSELKKEIISLNKEIKSKDLTRFIEEAGWK